MHVDNQDWLHSITSENMSITIQKTMAEVKLYIVMWNYFII